MQGRIIRSKRIEAMCGIAIHTNAALPRHRVSISSILCLHRICSVHQQPPAVRCALIIVTTSQAQQQQQQQRLIKTIIFITIAVLANSFGNLMLAIGMDRMPDFARVGISHYLLLLISSPFVIPGAIVSFIYTLAQLSLFSWADLSYVVPCVASSYIVTTLLSEFILDEPIHVQRWVGVVLIVCGVALVAETPECTTIAPDGTEHPC